MSAPLYRRGLLVAGAAGLVAGCGFQPVYMPTASGAAGPAERELAAIQVNRLPDRPGQLLRQALQQRLGGSETLAPKYLLDVRFGIAGEGIAIRPDTAATRIRLIGTADWYLNMSPGGQRVTNGSARVVDGFNILDQQYFASDLDNEKTQQRLAQALADQIAIQLAVYFRRQAAVASR